MLMIKAWHIIAMVAWFAGLFYLPRLFVYHVQATDELSCSRFKIMERRLYYGITWPAGIMTAFFGTWLLSFNPNYYLKAGWLHGKLGLVLLVWMFHFYCGHFVKSFAKDISLKSENFFRLFNEVPTVLLVVIVILVVVKPF
ncbi:MAG: protoporphyrinogen oxidase HemJ [Legionella sp.]